MKQMYKVCLKKVTKRGANTTTNNNNNANTDDPPHAEIYDDITLLLQPKCCFVAKELPAGSHSQPGISGDFGRITKYRINTRFHIGSENSDNKNHHNETGVYR